jgi:hypothetical protein
MKHGVGKCDVRSLQVAARFPKAGRPATYCPKTSSGTEKSFPMRWSRAIKVCLPCSKEGVERFQNPSSRPRSLPGSPFLGLILACCDPVVQVVERWTHEMVKFCSILSLEEHPD